MFGTFVSQTRVSARHNVSTICGVGWSLRYREIGVLIANEVEESRHRFRFFSVLVWLCIYVEIYSESIQGIRDGLVSERNRLIIANDSNLSYSEVENRLSRPFIDIWCANLPRVLITDIASITLFGVDEQACCPIS